jgi:hypothetical protein
LVLSVATERTDEHVQEKEIHHVETPLAVDASRGSSDGVLVAVDFGPG